MDRKFLLFGTGIFLALWTATAFYFQGLPISTEIGGDAALYRDGALHLFHEGTYTISGYPSNFREPGFSAFLSFAYTFLGTENAIGLGLLQGILLLVSAYILARSLAASDKERIGAWTFVITATLVPFYKLMFDGYRETFAAVLVFLLAAVWLHYERHREAKSASMLGLLLGVLILTYYSYSLLPLALLGLVFLKRMEWKYWLLSTVIAYSCTGAWALRNADHGLGFQVIHPFRPTVMWQVRGEQAEKLSGLEPLRCLMSEYITRDWRGRSTACSYNAVMHEKFPEIITDRTVLEHMTSEGKNKILANFGAYLWMSATEILELHLPYLGAGWGTPYNIAVSASMFLLYLGCIFGLRSTVKAWKEFALPLLLIGYTTGVFIFTDATPRYLVPVLGMYAIIAAVGVVTHVKKMQR